MSIGDESTASPPHTVISSAAGHSAVDSSEADQPAAMGCDAADRDNIASESTPSSELTSPVGGDTVLSTADSQSVDKPQSAANTENIEPLEEGGETASVMEAEAVPTTGGSEAVVQEGGEPVSAAEIPEPTESVEKCETEVDKVGEVNKAREVDKVDEMDVGNGKNSIVDDPEHPSTSTDKTDMSSTLTTGAGTVTSSEKNIDDDYLALTYLVHPPDGSTFNQPYLDNFWKCRWSRMESEIRRMLRKSSRLASDVITLGSSSSSDYDSSEGDVSDYEDSMASASPIFVQEKKSSTADDNDGNDSCDEIVLDENSSNAIVVGDDDDNVGEDDDDDVDEIVCSGGTNDENKNGDSSIVICDGEISIDESPPRSESAVSRPNDVESVNCHGTDAHSSEVIAEPVAVSSDQDPEAETVKNGSADVPGTLDETEVTGTEVTGLVDKTDRPVCEPQAGDDTEADNVVSNGSCAVAASEDS